MNHLPPQTYSDIMQLVSNHMSLSLEHEGYSPLVGKIFTLLLFATEPLSIQEMAERLGVTKAAISVHIRAMERNDLCSKRPTSSDRKNYYTLSDGYNMAWIRSFQDKLKQSHEVVQTALEASGSLTDMTAVERDSLKQFRQRCKEISEIQQLMMASLRQLHQDWQEARMRLR